MHIEIQYFGMIAEVTGCSQEQLSLSESTIIGLKKELFQKYPALQVKDFRIAQNQELVSDSVTLTGEKLALLPPFAGG